MAEDARVVARVAEQHRRRVAVDERAPHGRVAGSSEVDQVRRDVRDLKHDVRMLRVVLDRQTVLLQRLSG